LIWRKGGGVNGCTECVCCTYCYGESEVGLTVVLNVCVVDIVMEKGRWGYVCTECVCCEYCYGEREVGLLLY
jgi:hypothetical protein